LGQSEFQFKILIFVPLRVPTLKQAGGFGQGTPAEACVASSLAPGITDYGKIKPRFWGFQGILWGAFKKGSEPSGNNHWQIRTNQLGSRSSRLNFQGTVVYETLSQNCPANWFPNSWPTVTMSVYG
jgi:hypothetical protein